MPTKTIKAQKLKTIKIQRLPSLIAMFGYAIMALGLVALIEKGLVSGIPMIASGLLMLPNVESVIFRIRPKITQNNLIFIATILLFVACLTLVSHTKEQGSVAPYNAPAMKYSVR